MCFNQLPDIIEIFIHRNVRLRHFVPFSQLYITVKMLIFLKMACFLAIHLPTLKFKCMFARF